MTRTVLFDCDSTLSSIEGIDELGRGRAAEIAALTDAAMRGVVPLEAVYGKRLELIRPDRAAVDALGALYVRTLVPDARETVGALQRAGVTVAIISGGLRPAVLAVAAELGVPPALVRAVDIDFDDAGAYAGFDAASPLARAGGKPDVIRAWGALARPLMFVGDGATDLEAMPVVDTFVAYAGVVARDAVVRAAHVVIRSASLAPVLPLALGAGAELAAQDRPVHARGLALLRAGGEEHSNAGSTHA